jgi:hypothetical protein
MLLYNTPTLSSLDQFNAPSDHEAEIFIIGNNFGSEVYSELTRAGGSGSISTDWMSNTQVAAKLANGVRQRHSVIASVSEQVGTLQAILSFDSHYLGNVDRGREIVAYNIANSEDRWILVSGNGFGTLDWSTCVCVDRTAAESTVWNSESQVQSQSSVGVSSGLALVVTFAKKSVTRERMLSYLVLGKHHACCQAGLATPASFAKCRPAVPLSKPHSNLLSSALTGKPHSNLLSSPLTGKPHSNLLSSPLTRK